MKKYLLFALFIILMVKISAQTNVEDVKMPSTTISNSFYPGNKAPLQPLPFIKLPVGSIKPKGWIARCLELQKDGLTGHLDEISMWLDTADNAWLRKDGKGSKGFEEVPYWLRGYSLIGYLTDDSLMIAKSKVWINAAFASQHDDGFFGPITIRNNGKRDIWSNMLMLWVMQDYYEYTSDERVIPFMTKYFKWEMNQPDDDLMETYWDNSRGGDNLYSIIWLYNITGEKWLLDLATKIHKNTADWCQPDQLPNWHNVNIAQGFREPATYFMVAKDSSFLEDTYRDFNMVRNIYGQVSGGMFGSDENCRPGYSDPRQGTETCGFAEQMDSDEMLISLTGDAFWADHCEDVAFNSYPAAFMPDYKALRYITSPNMIVSDSKNHWPSIQNNGPFLMMNPFSSRCCQHNHTHCWPYYAKSLWMASPDNGLAAVLFNSCEVTAKAGSGSIVTITETTNYPFEEKINFSISLKNSDTFPLYFRIPEWCDNAAIKINGEEVAGKFEPGTYARILREWKDSDKIELNLPMNISVKQWDENKNSVSVNYGPLTFSLEIKEKYVKMSSTKTAIHDSGWQRNVDQEKWPSFEIYADSPWNYGLVLNDKPELSFTVVHKKWPADNYPFTQESVPIIIKAEGKIIPQWKLDSTGLCDVLPKSPVAVGTKTDDITLIPMGAARLRITSFPVAKKQ